MARHHLVLIITCDAQRRDTWHAATRSAGHHALPAHTLDRARFLLGKVCPSLVLMDAELGDGHVLALLRHIRAVEPLTRVVVVVFGDLAPEEHEHIAADDRSHARHKDTSIGQVLDEFLAVG